MSKKISQLTEVTNNTTSDVFVCNQSGSTLKTTLQKIADAIFGAEDAGSLPLGSSAPSGSTAEAIKDLITTESQSTTASFGANSSATVDIDCTKAGYKLIGICGFSCYYADMNVGRINIRGGQYPNTIRMDILNHNNSARSNVSISVTALYIKTFT